jgi:hypothetical protein
MIGSVAKDVDMLNSHVTWTQMALEAAMAERKPKAHISNLKRVVALGQMEHDQVGQCYKTFLLHN